MMDAERLIDEHEISTVKDILKTFATTVKTFSTYPKNNPIYKKFSEQLFGKFSSFFETHETLSLEVELFTLKYEGEEVYKNEERNSNIALQLFVDGIRHLSFQSGLTNEEIVEFIDILRLAPKEDNPEDDIVTMLWDKALEHVVYFVPERVGELELSIEDSLITLEAAPATAGPAALPAEAPEGSTSERTGSASLKLGCAGMGSSATAPEHLRSGLLQEIAELDHKGLLLKTTRLLFAMMPGEHNEQDFMEYAKSIGRAIDAFAERGDVESVVKVLKKLSSMRESFAESGRIAALEEAAARAGGRDKLDFFFNDESAEDAVKEYLALLPFSCVPAVLEVLKETPHRRLRRIMSETAVSMARTNPEAFIKALRDKNSFFVRTVVFILGKAGVTEAIPALQDLVYHHDKLVRQGLVRSLALLGDPKVKLPLMKLLNDNEPEVKLDALKALAGFNDPTLAMHITERVLSDQFAEEPFEIKKQFFIALGRIGRADALPLLAQVFNKKTLFKRRENDAMRACAAFGLGFVGTPEAAELLKKEAGGGSNIVSDACRQSLERLKSGTH